MKSKKIIASLALTSMLFTTVGSFAADRDIWSVSPEQVYATKMEFAKEKAKRLEVAKTPSNYYFEAHGHLFTMKAANEAFAKNPEGFLPDLKVADAVKPINMDLHVVSVSAINSTEAELLFNKEVKMVKASNFTVMDKDQNIVAVLGAKVDEKDKKKVVVTFASAFEDKMEYTVETVGVIDVDGKEMAKDSDKFTYEKAELAKVEFTETTVPVLANLKDYVKATDALGRDITKEVTLEFTTSRADIVDNNGDAVAEGQSIVTVKASLGEKSVQTEETTIIVTASNAASFVGYYLSSGAVGVTDTKAFEKLKDEEKVTFVNINDTNKYFNFYYKDQFGESLPRSISAVVTPATPTVALIDSITKKIVPVSVGDAYFKVVDGKVTTTIKVTVRPEAKAEKMIVEEKEISTNNQPSNGVKTVQVSFEDQFGSKFVPTTGTFEAKSKDVKIATAVGSGYNLVTITPVLNAEGSTIVEVTYKDGDVTLKEEIKVTVSKAGPLAGYEMVADKTKLDIKNPAAPENKATVTVYGVDAKGVRRPEGAIDLTLADNEIKAVDAEGNPTEEFIQIQNHKEVVGKKVGTAYVQVKVKDYTEKKLLKIEVMNSGQQATKVVVPAKIDLGLENNLDPAVGVDVDAKVKAAIEIKDQNDGDFKTAPGYDPLKFVVKYNIYDQDTLEFDSTQPGAKLIKIKARKGVAKLVVTEATYDGADLLNGEKPLAVLEARDEEAPKVTGVVNGMIYNASTTPALDGGNKDLKSTKLTKDGADVAGYALGTALDHNNEQHAYVLTVTDHAGNENVIRFVVDQKKPVATVEAAGNTQAGFVVKLDGKLFRAGSAVASGDIKADFTPAGGTLSITSAAYNADTLTITFVVENAADTNTITRSGALTDEAGNAWDADVFTFASATNTWSK